MAKQRQQKPMFAAPIAVLFTLFAIHDDIYIQASWFRILWPSNCMMPS